MLSDEEGILNMKLVILFQRRYHFERHAKNVPGNQEHSYLSGMLFNIRNSLDQSSSTEENEGNSDVIQGRKKGLDLKD